MIFCAPDGTCADYSTVGGSTQIPFINYVSAPRGRLSLDRPGRQPLHKGFLHEQIQDDNGKRRKQHVCEHEIPHGGIRADGVVNARRDRFAAAETEDIHGVEEIVPDPHAQKDHRRCGAGFHQREDDLEKRRKRVGAVDIRRFVNAVGKRFDKPDVEKDRRAEIRSAIEQQADRASCTEDAKRSAF